MNVENVRPKSAAAEVYCPRLAREHLDALNRAQAELLGALARKRDATKEPKPNPISICRARWNVSRACRNHRAIVASIVTELMTGAGSADLALIISLQRAGIQQTQRSTRHIQEWTPERVMTDWRGFCDASAQIQVDIEQRIHAELALVGRMLRDRASTAAQAWWQT
jgi:hypothetical protein